MKRSLMWLSALLAPVVVAAQDNLAELEQAAIKAAAARASRSVVRIETLGGVEKVDNLMLGIGPTSGVVVSPDGYILSSVFNFLQQPAAILVTLPSGARVAAKIVSRDHSRMLVLLKANVNEKLAPAEAVPLEEMHVGQWAIAMGRTFEVDQPNLSVGILSALDRIWGKAIQTDAKVSPNNYGGPLIDIRGRVLGVLTPLSPQDNDVVAGAEWYDSGIGFAAPLVSVFKRLDAMKQGLDLHPGLLGVSLKGRDVYGEPAVIAAVQAKSPAADAGLKKGDRVVRANGVRVERIAQLKQALGPLYAGDKAPLTVLRGEQRLDVVVELTDKLAPYEHAFLGLLPLRSPAAQRGGAVVRFVYPGSGAAKAAIRAGDRLAALASQNVADAAAARDLIAGHSPGETITVELERDGAKRRVEVQLTSLPTSLPGALPAARTAPPAAAGDRPPVGVVAVKIPEEPNECIAYVPESYHPAVEYALVVWLDAPGAFDQKALVQRWKPHCESQDLILLAPRPADPANWQATETTFLRKAMDDVLADYNVDRSRVVVYGYQAGGVMAYLTAFAHRDLVRGVAVVDAPLPLRSQLPANEPLQRLAVFSAAAEKSGLAKRIQAGVDRIRELKYPVTVMSLGDQARQLTDQELAEWVRWFDTLDRI